MRDSVVRLQAVTIENFQNVEKGNIQFVCNCSTNVFEKKADILGIYGQNASGKTSFLQVLTLLREVMCGNPLPFELDDCITFGKKLLKIKAEFSVEENGKFYLVTYSFIIRKDKNMFPNESHYIYNKIAHEFHGTVSQFTKTARADIGEEAIEYKEYLDGKFLDSITLIKYNKDTDSYFEYLVNFKDGDNQNFLEDLRVAQKISARENTAFVFSLDLRKIIKNPDNMLSCFVQALREYAYANLYIIKTSGWGAINLNLGMPLYFKIKHVEDSKQQVSMGVQMLNMNEPTIFPIGNFDVIKEATDVLNLVLDQIVPKLQIEIHKTGIRTLASGREGVEVECLSVRGDVRIPLKYESAGVRKIVAFLNMFIYTYNNPSMTLAIDELDAGVYEFLLGELLRIFKETGKGQLIFTSHNLRPLETLDRLSIVFTTTNPKNRYIRIRGSKDKNYRNTYIHDIVLGGQKESLYDLINTYEIAYVMKKAGKLNG